MKQRSCPARVNSITFTSVISDNGAMLTQGGLKSSGGQAPPPADVTKDARFWFAFVNQNGVWPWREADQILIPLEQQSRHGAPLAVEVVYSSQIGDPAGRALDLQLVAPKFDLPLEKITWRVYLNEKWKVKKWTGCSTQHEGWSRGGCI